MVALSLFPIYFLSIIIRFVNCVDNLSSSVWITEYPTLSGSLNHARLDIIGGNVAQYEFLLQQVIKENSKLYITIKSKNESEFVNFLNVTLNFLDKVVWTPCIILYWPREVLSSHSVEKIMSNIITSQINSKLTFDSELYIVFEIISFQPCFCDLFTYKRGKTSHKFHCFVPSVFVQDFFSYNPTSIRRKDLNGTTLNVVAQYDPDYKERIKLIELNNGKVIFSEGMCLHILSSLQIAMNFRYIPLKGNGWAGISENGSWTGMAAQLINGQADVSIAQASMLMMMDQMKGISFLQASSTGHLVALFQQPKASSHRNILVSVLSKECWMLFFFVWGNLIVSVYILSFLQRKIPELEVDLSLVEDVVLWATSTACVLGWYQSPISKCFRVLCLTASCFAYLIYVAFSAELMVNLITEVHPIKNFQELSSSSLQVYTDKWLPMARNLIENIYTQRGVQIPKQNSVLYTVDQGLPKVIDEKDDKPFAFVTFIDAVKIVFDRMNYTDRFFCDTISSVLVASARTPLAMFVKRASPLKEILNYNVLLMSESGILSRLNKQYDMETQILCSPNPNNYRGGLSLDDTFTPFVSLIIGMSFCILTFICERLCKNFIRK